MLYHLYLFIWNTLCFIIHICYDLVLGNNSANSFCRKACSLQQDQIIVT